MLTLTRNDGVEFVMQAYRELIKNGNKAAVVQKVRSLSEQHGRFVRLFKKEGGHYEGVFSNDAGYLLGESVKHYFYQAQNLIFCEEFDDKQRVLVVVVRNGEVYLDAVIAKINLQQELRLLIGDPYKYQIYTHGDTPLKEILNPNKNQDISFSFPAEKIKSFETISNALFARLPTIKSLQLLPLPSAIKAQHLQNNRSTISYIAVSIIAIAGGWLLLNAINQLKHHRLSTPAVHNIYQSYTNAMQTPAPNIALQQLMQTIDELYSLPGWEAKSIDFENNHYSIRLKSAGGGLTSLSSWCAANHYAFHLNYSSPTLKKNSYLAVRRKTNPISSAEMTLDYITDKLDPLLGSSNVIIGNTKIFSAARQIPITLEIQKATPKILDIIARLIQNQPLVTQSAHFKLDGIIISGQVQLSIWGN